MPWYVHYPALCLLPPFQIIGFQGVNFYFYCIFLVNCLLFYLVSKDSIVFSEWYWRSRLVHWLSWGLSCELYLQASRKKLWLTVNLLNTANTWTDNNCNQIKKIQPATKFDFRDIWNMEIRRAQVFTVAYSITVYAMRIPWNPKSVKSTVIRRVSEIKEYRNTFLNELREQKQTDEWNDTSIIWKGHLTEEYWKYCKFGSEE